MKELSQHKRRPGLAPAKRIQRRATQLAALATTAVSLAAVLGATGCSSSSAETPSCRELDPEVSALEAKFGGGAFGPKTAAYVQSAKDLAWASNRLEQDVAAACRRIGNDIGLGAQEMPNDKGPGGEASGICNAVNARFAMIQRQEGLRVWVTITAPTCVSNQNAWNRCSTVCNPADPQCNALCKIHANVHAKCQQAQVRVRPARGSTVPPYIMSTLQANLASIVHGQAAIAERLRPDVVLHAQAGAGLPGLMAGASSDTLDCVGAGSEVSNQAARRLRISNRAATDLLVTLQGR